ncbi:MAG: Hsp70 family protein [Clostridium sp.]|nr:Hsp70 family protein [Bacteroides sp.]MCM1197576.1 Hsp70 family protein [Clostridium sp.]
MKHITIDYGIDLGTTNSAICRMEQGVPAIIRSDNGMETMPSCISFKKSGSLNVGYSAYSDLGHTKLRALKKKSALTANSCTEFKRFMGSDMTYTGTYAEHIWTPEELSAQILKSLCSFVQDEEVTAAVITVPAKFTVNQKDATLEAAHLAGLEQVELLQEPIAASMAYGLKAEEKNGIWMVFDFGGGTLDVALIHVCDGIMQVFDTEGDNYLGGKNLDEAIVSKILMPELLSRYVFDSSDSQLTGLLTDALKVVAERLKNALSYKESETICLEAGDWGEDEEGEEIEMELTITRQQLNAAIRPILQKAVDVCKNLMLRNRISYGKLSHLILVGGPTYIPLLREMLREQVTGNVETGIDPMTAVARGAAVYAATIPLKKRETIEDDSDDVQLEIDFETTTVDNETYVTVHSKNEISGLEVKLIRTEDGWESAPCTIGPKGGLIIAGLLAGRPNIFAVTAKVNGEDVACFPSEMTIIQGIKAGSAILPYNIGIEVYSPKKKRMVFTSMTGLEKNRTLPASGMVYGLKNMSEICHGNKNTELHIAIYQGDSNAEGKTAALYEYVSDVVVTGNDVTKFISKGSHVNVRIDVDRSEMMTVTCEFPATGQNVKKKLDTSKRKQAKSEEYLRDLIARIYSQLRNLDNELDDDAEVLNLMHRLKMVKESLVTGVQLKQVELHLKEVMRSVEEFESQSEWDRCQKALKDALFSLQIQGAKHSEDAEVTRMVDSFCAQVERVLEIRDERKAKFLQHQIEEYKYAISKDEIYRNIIRWADREFSSIEWTNRAKAQKLVMVAADILRKNPNATFLEIKDITEQIYALIKPDEKESSSSSDNLSSRISKNNILSM